MKKWVKHDFHVPQNWLLLYWIGRYFLKIMHLHNNWHPDFMFDGIHSLRNLNLNYMFFRKTNCRERNLYSLPPYSKFLFACIRTALLSVAYRRTCASCTCLSDSMLWGVPKTYLPREVGGLSCLEVLVFEIPNECQEAQVRVAWVLTLGTISFTMQYPWFKLMCLAALAVLHALAGTLGWCLIFFLLPIHRYMYLCEAQVRFRWSYTMDIFTMEVDVFEAQMRVRWCYAMDIFFYVGICFLCISGELNSHLLIIYYVCCYGKYLGTQAPFDSQVGSAMVHNVLWSRKKKNSGCGVTNRGSLCIMRREVPCGKHV